MYALLLVSHFPSSQILNLRLFDDDISHLKLASWAFTLANLFDDHSSKAIWFVGVRMGHYSYPNWWDILFLKLCRRVTFPALDAYWEYLMESISVTKHLWRHLTKWFKRLSLNLCVGFLAWLIQTQSLYKQDELKVEEESNTKWPRPDEISLDKDK